MDKSRILIVDDEIEFVELLTEFLESNDFIVESVNEGLDLFNKINDGFDLILLDRTLPDVEGLEVCHKIREDKTLCHIPIIILTARDTVEDKIEGLYIGADDYVTKPFNSEELLARIKAAIRRSNFSLIAVAKKDEFIAEIKNIVKDNSITSLFQPIFSTQTIKPIGVEITSLPVTRGPLKDYEFLIKAALIHGLSAELEKLCLTKGISKCKSLNMQGKILVQCSSNYLETNQIDEKFFSGLNIQPDDILLEIKEHKAVNNREIFLNRINALKKIGVQTSLDDIGRGQADLRTLIDMKPNFVKIKETLIKDVHIDAFRRNIVKSIADYCQGENIKTIAEGITSNDQFRVVSELGVDAVQGDLLFKAREVIDADFFNDIKSFNGKYQVD